MDGILQLEIIVVALLKKCLTLLAYQTRDIDSLGSGFWKGKVTYETMLEGDKCMGIAVGRGGEVGRVIEHLRIDHVLSYG